MRQNITEAQLTEIWTMAKEAQEPPSSMSDLEFSIFRQYQSIHKALATAWASAPAKAIELAKSIVPATKRTFRIGLLIRPRPALGLARGAVSQVQFESEDVVVRMQIEDIPNGWKIWGRTNQPGWTVWSGQSSQACDARGEFVLEVHGTSLEPFSLQNESVTILLPMSDDEIGDGER